MNRTEGAPFPSTHWSVLKPDGGESDARQASLEALARLYWRPVYAHFRFRWNRTRAEAEDITQNFFIWVLDSPFIDRAEEGHGRFRNFVRSHLDNFMRNHLRAEKRQKRGGDRKFFSLNFGDDPDAGIADAKNLPPEEILDHEWKRAVLDQAMERLKEGLERDGRPKVFEVFERYDLIDEANRPSYTELANQLEIAVHHIDNYLSQARKRLYELLREVISESVDSPDSLQRELDAFFPNSPK